ncbi:MAG: AsmA family protein [Hyphomicrobium sp.]
MTTYQTVKRKGQMQTKKSSFMSSFIKIVVSLVGGILGLGVIGISFLFFLNPSDIIREQLKVKIKNELGRDLSIGGSSSFTFYPLLGVTLQDVSLSGPEGFSGAPLITMQGLGIGMEFLPLLKGKIFVDHIVLTKPSFHFEVDQSGLKSWDFKNKSTERKGSTAVPDTQRGEQDKTDASSLDKTTDAASSSIPLGHLSLRKIRVEDGTFNYGDLGNNTKEIVTDVNFEVSLPDLGGEAELSGRTAWRGETFLFASKVQSVKNLLSNEPAQLTVQIEGGSVTASFKGILNPKTEGESTGKLSVEVPSLSYLLALTKGQDFKTKPTDPCSLSGNLALRKNIHTLNVASLRCPSSQGTGEVTIITNQERPFIKARLDFSKLNLPFISTRGSEVEIQETPQNKEGEQKEVPQSSDQDQQPSSRGTKKVGWDEAPLDYGTLGGADLEATLRVEEGSLKDIKFGKSLILLSLKNRILETKLNNINLYEGTAKGTVVVNATDPKTPEIDTNLDISTIQLQSFLRDAARMDWLMGKGSLLIKIKGKGPTQKALVESLSGSADLKLQDGAIVGMNVAGLFRNQNKGFLGGLKSTPSEKTDFSELSSHWSIAQGVARNEDLQLLSPLLRVSGSGDILLANRSFDYGLRPSLVADLSGQGGNQNLSGILLPVRIHGPWEKPKFSPDIKGILDDPNKTVETIKEIGKQFKGKNAADILNTILGKGDGSSPSQNTNQDPNSSPSAAPNQTTPPPKTSKTEQFLKQFLNP